jgi:ribulose 1,5-bisphosphate synthetase/thiazole synthase
VDGMNTGSEDCSAGGGPWTGGTLGQRIVVQVAVCGREKIGSEDCSADSGLWTGGILGQRIVVQVAVCGTGGSLVRGL